MKTSTIAHRARLATAGIAILALAPAAPSWAYPAPPSSGCCNRPQTSPVATETQYPYSARGNPMGFHGLSSPEQSADEGTLDQGTAQVDAEVGAGEGEVVQVTKRPAHGAGTQWVTQSLAILLALVIVSIGVRWIFLPSDRIPRIGSARSGSDG